MLESVGLRQGHSIDFTEFQRIFETQGDIFRNVNIDLEKLAVSEKDSRFSLYGSIPEGGFAAKATRQEYEEVRQEVLADETGLEEVLVVNTLRQYYNSFVNSIRKDIPYVFWRGIYTIVMLLIFVERAYYYS